MSGSPARSRRITLPADPEQPPATIDPADPPAQVTPIGEGVLRIRSGDGTTTRATLGTTHRPDHRGTDRVEVVVDGWRFELEVEPERRAVLRERARRDHEHGQSGGPSEIRAIIPGRVVAVGVASGDEVAVGDRLFVLEAMKMQNELRAQRAGRVSRVAVGEGQTVEAGDLLLVLE